jgi:hypothetical protein
MASDTRQGMICLSPQARKKREVGEKKCSFPETAQVLMQRLFVNRRSALDYTRYTKTVSHFRPVRCLRSRRVEE